MRLLWFINQGYKRPSELQRKIPDASRRIWRIQLKELEDHELVSKVIYPVELPKAEYSLTDFGKTLIPLIAAIGDWGDEHEERLRALILKRLNIAYFTKEFLQFPDSCLPKKTCLSDHHCLS
jgi:DNA-binding HxlR family transcriptional regulator